MPMKRFPPKQAGEIQAECPAELANKQSEEAMEPDQDLLAERKNGASRKRAKIPPSAAMDYKQTISPVVFSVKSVEDFQSEIGSQSVGVSIEKQREDVNISEMPGDVLMQEFQTNLKNGGVPLPELNGSKANLMMTMPGNSDSNMRYFPCPGSGHALQPHYSEVHLGSKKRRFSASIHTGSSLGPVAEESPFHNPNFKLARLPKNGLAPEIDLTVEIRPTQTQKPPVLDEPVEHITGSIRTQLKAHFDTPGSLPRLESLNQLASGMNKKKASHLFYQTCVLATRDIIRVEQEEAYGDILIEGA